MTRWIFTLSLLSLNAPVFALELPKTARHFAPEIAIQASKGHALNALLRLKSGQSERLQKLFSAHANRRRTVETRIATSNIQLQHVQSPQNWNEKQANELLSEIRTARQSVETDLRTTRQNALAILSNTQRAQLESFPNDSGIELRQDELWQLLLMPVENLWQFAAAPPRETLRAARSNNARQKGSGRYGVYGGYGYGGPNYGVYGSYGQGPVGVHVGIGRGGPHFGIGVGGGFGWGR